MDRELRTQARLSRRTLTTQADIGNTVYGTEVHSVNGKAGHVVLDAEDVGALPNDTVIPTVPTDISAFNNDAGYLSDAYYLVTISYSNGAYVADRTYDECLSAYNSGKLLFATDVTGGFYPLTTNYGNALYFTGGSASNRRTFKFAKDGNNVTVTDTRLAKYNELPTVPTNVSDLNNDAGYLSDACFIVGIEMDSNNNYYADCTFAEALAEYKSGKILMAKFGGAIYWFSGINDSETSMAFATIFSSGRWVQHLTFRNTEAVTSILYKIPSKTSDLVNDSGFLSDAYFVITATADDETATVFTPDCTLAEAWTAFQSGKILLLKLGNVYLPSNFTSSSIIRFSSFNGTIDRDYTFNGQKITKISETVVLSEAYYIVTATQSSGSEYTTDHTFVETYNAYQSGKIPLLKVNDTLIPMSLVDYGTITFTKVNVYIYNQFTFTRLNSTTVLRSQTPLARQSDVYTKEEIDGMLEEIRTRLQSV